MKNLLIQYLRKYFPIEKPDKNIKSAILLDKNLKQLISNNKEIQIKQNNLLRHFFHKFDVFFHPTNFEIQEGNRFKSSDFAKEEFELFQGILPWILLSLKQTNKEQQATTFFNFFYRKSQKSSFDLKSIYSLYR